ncbi:MAG: hypothetical protein ACRD1X_08070 [Vicinamibacteria bacterium]
MRTTVEITDEQRAKLLELAAKRGGKGFSTLVQEALERYLEDSEEHDRRVREARSVLGKLSEKTARELETVVRRLRKTWR